MKTNRILSGCPHHHPLTRRRFLAAGCAGAAGLFVPTGLGRAEGLWEPALKARDAAVQGKTRIRVVYSLHAVKQPGPDWPNVGFDFGPVMDRINAALASRLPGFEFIPVMATGPEQAQSILAEDKAAATPVDGYLVYQLNCWNRVVQTFAESGKPVLYADFQYGGSGGFLVYTAAFLRSGAPNVGFVASSRIEDVAAAVQCFEDAKVSGAASSFAAATARVRKDKTPKAGPVQAKPDALTCLSPQETIARMKASKILAVGGNWPGIAPPVKEGMGIEVVNVPFAEVNDAWAAADKDQVREIAARWRTSAARIEGVSDAELENSAAMYLAEKAVLEKHGAEAFTMNCLGGFYGGHIHAYPCLGYHELLNEGLIGGCECDVRSAATMVAITALTKGRPGYISDPVIDTASRQIIYAHCVASNRAFGPQGGANPFQILTHSEDRQGASVRSILPVGWMTSSLEVSPEKKTILFHRGPSVGNVDDDRACRTKLAVEPVGDIEKLFGEWDQWGWHRVTFYGDLKEPVYGLADALGWQVLEEA